jgi:phosphoribosylformylglycinamidine cyclo-ligase
VGFVIEYMPDTPAIFKMIQEHYPVSAADEMFMVYNMGVGFCVVVDETKVSLALSILEKHERKAWVIDKVVEDESKGVYVNTTKPRLIGHKKRFREE